MKFTTVNIETLSKQKWEKMYRDWWLKKKYDAEYEKYQKLHFKDIYHQIEKEHKIKNSVFLEIGCGPAFFSQAIAHKCHQVIGIDFSESGLKIAEKMFAKKRIKNYQLIKSSINNLPLLSKSVDIVYGGGVLEHLENPAICLAEIYRVLKKGGVSFNTVPNLNLGTLTYRQIWGNIPYFPILRQIAEFIHIKLLRGKHMRFGYELSFLASTLVKMHKNAGFSHIEVKKFTVKLTFDYLPEKFRGFFIPLAEKSPLFWPMIKVIAKK